MSKYALIHTTATVRRELTEAEQTEMLEKFTGDRFEYILSPTEFSPNNLMTSTTTLSNGTGVTYRQYSPATAASKFIIVGYEVVESRHRQTEKLTGAAEIARIEQIEPEPTDWENGEKYTRVSLNQLKGEVRERNLYFKALRHIADAALEATDAEEPTSRGYNQIIGELKKAGILEAKRQGVS